MNKIPRNAIGLGLRIPHYGHIFSEWPKVDFFEIISENFMGEAPLPKKNLERILTHYPVVLHGVSLGIASADPLDYSYLQRLKALAAFTSTPFFTDHLCWTSAHGIHHHDLLPVPYTEENAQYIAERISEVQDFIGLPFGLENLSSYASFKESEMEEWEFYNRVVDLAGCSYMLDINNIFVSSVNHGFSMEKYLESISWKKVVQCHIAGHIEKPDGSLLDTHDHAIRPEVWQAYKYAWKLSGGFPTLLERDDKIPPFPEVHAEALRAREFQVLD